MSATPLHQIASIEEVDRYILSELPPKEAIAKLNPFELHILEQSPIYARLLHLKFLFRLSPAVDEQFQKRREAHEQDAPTPTYLHLRSYEKAFMEINRANDNCFGGGRVQHFLDLGCSPGGFSNWLMKSNRRARGVGVTLPDEEAKFSMPVELSTFGPRYHVLYDNIITLVMRAVAEGTNPVVQLHDHACEGELDSYDLVIAGAFPTLEGHIPWFLRVQLVFSQLLIIISNLAPGGACILTINTKAFMWLVDMIGLLQHCFDSVDACKSGKLHAMRTSCYLVCRGFHASHEDVSTYTGRLRKALATLDAMSAESRADGGAVHTMLGVDIGAVRVGSPEALPLVFADSEDHLIRLGMDKYTLALFEPLWSSQHNAIHDEFAQVLSNVMDGGVDENHSGHRNDDLDQPDGVAGTQDSSPQPPKWRPRRQSLSAASCMVRSSGKTSLLASSNDEERSSFPGPTAPLDTPPSSPHVPKWRPPQRRMSTTGDTGSGDHQDWRRPAITQLDEHDAFGASPSKGEKYTDPFFRKRSQSNATNASTWRRG